MKSDGVALHVNLCIVLIFTLVDQHFLNVKISCEESYKYV